MGKNVLNNFSFNNFLKKALFLEKMGKKFWGYMTIFKEKGASYVKNEYNLFYGKLDTKYFYIK